MEVAVGVFVYCRGFRSFCFRLGWRFDDGQRLKDGIEQVADAERVLGGDGEDGLEAETAVVFGLSY